MKTNQAIKRQFLLHPKITFLNHGSFGACPKPIFDDYQKWQLLLEKEPVQFITKTGLEYLNQSKQALASFLNIASEDFVFVTNPTFAMNIVIKNLKLKKNDEVLTTNQEYGAIDRTWKYYCQIWDAKYVQQEIKLPLVSKESFLKQFWKGLTPKTKVIFLSHITSQTALIFPVKEIIEKAKTLGIIIIIDGAHVPAHIPLDITELDPDIYTGACHKWMLTPKGNSFLYIRKELQYTFDPLIISWGYNAAYPSGSKFHDYHQYNGTRDFSAFLTTPAAIKFMEQNQWEEQKKICRKLLSHYYPIVAKELDSSPICSVSEGFLGQMCSIPIKTSKPVELKELLYNKYQIEIPIIQTPESVFLRISFQAYNGENEIHHLVNAIRKIKSTTNLLG